MSIVVLNPEMNEKQAMALAQFLKRSGFTDYRRCAVTDDEAYAMQDAAFKIQQSLNKKGFAPR